MDPFERKISTLYTIVDKGTLDAHGVSVGAFARELCAAGVRLVQYRDKAGSPQEVLRGARVVAEAFTGVDAALVLNDRADLAALLGWGVHVGQGDLPLADAGRLVGDRVIGASTHTEEQVRVASVGRADYVAVGPVFATSTKGDAEPVVGLEGVRRARVLTSKPLVAIGGITRENCRSVVEAGADAVAVIGGLFVQGMSVGTVVEDFLERMR